MKKHLLLLCLLLGLVGTRASAAYDFEENGIGYLIDRENDGVVTAFVHSDYPYSTLTINKVTHNGKTYLIDMVLFSNSEHHYEKPFILHLQKLTIGPDVTSLSVHEYHVDVKEIIFEDGEKIMYYFGGEFSTSNGFYDSGLHGIETTYCGRDFFYDGWGFDCPYDGSGETLKSITIGEKVTTINPHFFDSMKNITYIEIPTSVKTIRNGAFSDCTKLETFVIKGNPTVERGIFDGCSSLRTIGGNGPKIVEGYAFRGLTSLETISLSAAEEIGNNAFEGCTNLSSVSLDNCATIEFDAFKGCSKLKTVYLGNKLSQIGTEAFMNCTSLSSISIPGSVPKLGTGIFEGCSALKSVMFGEGFTEIGFESFMNCTSLNSVEFPNSLTYIESKAFYGCTKLQTLKFPGNIRGIQQSAFENCTGITTLQFAKLNDQAATYGSLSINDAAFKNCTSLTSFVAPDGPAIDYGYGSYVFPTNIHQQVFYGCTNLKTVEFTGMSFYPSSLAECPNLKSITLKNTIAPLSVVNDYTLPNKLFTSATLYVPNDLVDSYKTHNYWKQFTNIRGIDDTGGGTGGDEGGTGGDEGGTGGDQGGTGGDEGNTGGDEGGTGGDEGGTSTQDRSGVYSVSYDDFLTDGNTYPWTPPANFTFTVIDLYKSFYLTNLFGLKYPIDCPFTFSDANTAVTGQQGFITFYQDNAQNIYCIARAGSDDKLYSDVSVTFDETGNMHFGDLYIVIFFYDATTDSYPQGKGIYCFTNLVAKKNGSNSVPHPTSDDADKRCTVINGSIVLSTEQPVQIYNTTGGLVYTGITSKVDNLSKGMYIVRMGDKTQKVLIK